MKTINLIETVSMKESSDNIPLMIKYCPGGALAEIIKNIPHTDYRITGPFGKGLGLK
jgi:NAD(P)H-flavin reductase